MMRLFLLSLAALRSLLALRTPLLTLAFATHCASSPPVVSAFLPFFPLLLFSRTSYFSTFGRCDAGVHSRVGTTWWHACHQADPRVLWMTPFEGHPQPALSLASGVPTGGMCAAS